MPTRNYRRFVRRSSEIETVAEAEEVLDLSSIYSLDDRGDDLILSLYQDRPNIETPKPGGMFTKIIIVALAFLVIIVALGFLFWIKCLQISCGG